VNSNGTCSADLSCPDGQYRNLQTNICVNGQISNCLKYTTNGDGLCIKCQSGYQIDQI